MSLISFIESILNCPRIRAIHQRLFGSRSSAISYQSNSVSVKTIEPPKQPSSPEKLKFSVRSLSFARREKTLAVSSSILEYSFRSSFSAMLQRNLIFGRPLSFIESLLLKRSMLLPSVVNPIKRAMKEIKNGVPKLKPAFLLLSPLRLGEIPATNPRDFLAELESICESFTDRMKDLKRFCKSLINANIDASLVFLDGKVSICAPSGDVMEGAVKPLINATLPWNASWDSTTMPALASSISTDSLTTIEFVTPTDELVGPFLCDTVVEESYQCEESDYGSCRSASSFSQVSLRDLFPDARPEELEVFSVWSDA